MLQSFSKNGLINIGNTCFMNSALQVLANTPHFLEYFLENIYEADINLVNQLGSRGEVASELAKLLKELCHGNRAVAPHNFKKAFAKHNNMYFGSNQHDVAEFLLHLLDTINEDVNHVHYKPYVEVPSSHNRDDLVVALEHWDAHTQRNQSIVVDLFQAQYKSKIECPHCKNVSITFDPYMMVQLPVVSAQTEKGIVFYLVDKHQRQKKYDLPLYKDYNVAWLKDEVRGLFRTEQVMFDLSDKTRTYEMPLQESLSSFKAKLKPLKLLVRPLSELELAVPYAQRLEVKFSHLNYEEESLTEVITLIFSAHCTMQDVYSYVDQTYAQHFNCHFELYLKSNSNKTDQSCYFCSKAFCDLCYIGQNQMTLSVYQNLIGDAAFKLNIAVKWFQQGVASIFSVDNADQQGGVVESNKGQVTIYDCLHYFQQPQQLDEDNPWYCKQCKTHVRGIKQLQLYSAAKIMVFHLKRFKNADFHLKTKNNVFIRYPLTLDLAKYVLNKQVPENYLGPEAHSVKYRLFGVVNHHGELDGGHYTSIVKDVGSNKWFNFDDSVVTEVKSKNDLFQQNAYVLFYIRDT